MIRSSATMSKPFALLKGCRSLVTDCCAKIVAIVALGRGKKRKHAGDDGKGKGSQEMENQLKHIRHFVNFTKWRMEVKRMRLSSSIFRKCGAILTALYESRAQSSPRAQAIFSDLKIWGRQRWRKRRLKRELTFFKSSSLSLQLTYFVKYRLTLLEFDS